jgi:membrane protease YdiL (CAAX protease family)
MSAPALDPIATDRPSPGTDGSRRPGRPGRAVLGALVMALALGAGPALGKSATDALGWTGFAARLVPAILVTAIAVPLILLLRRRQRIPARQLGLTGPRSSVTAFATGVAVTGGTAAAVFGAGTAAGWLTWSSVDPAALATFLVTNAVVALLLEALPEELTLRGYAWGTLRERYGAVLTGTLTTVLFLTVQPLSNIVAAAVTLALGGDPDPIGLAPAGEDPVAYVVLLVCFGLMLVTARTTTAGRSIWACVGAHLTFLTVNRVVLFGEERDAGWSADFASPDVVLLVPGYLLLAAAVFGVVGAILRRRDGQAP